MHVRRLTSTDAMAYAKRLRHRPFLALLDSAMKHPMLGRYSVVTCDPFGLFQVQDGRAFWNGAAVEGDPLSVLRKLLALYPQDTREDLPPFQGGAVGFITYEFGSVLEEVPRLRDGDDPPQLQLGFYDVAIAVDHVQGRAWLISTGWPEQDEAERSDRARSRADQFETWLGSPDRVPAPHEARPCDGGFLWHSNFDPGSYRAAVRQVTEYILAGDIFQANIAQRFRASCPAAFDPLAFYERLRAVNAAPFAAFLDCDGFAITSSSPERFLSAKGGRVEARPIKGTAPRSRDPAEDARALHALLASEKDRAENVMIVDLLRNDMSRVCRPHSVEVPVLCGAESYASVHHLVSAVTGVLAPGKDAIHLLAACFPGGSVTGAPKVRAMQIIAEIERAARGVYCGAIGYIGFDGTMDTNIAIRTVTFQGGQATIHSGGGVTLLSDPEAEYQETLTKVQRIFAAFEAVPGERTA